MSPTAWLLLSVAWLLLPAPRVRTSTPAAGHSQRALPPFNVTAAVAVALATLAFLPWPWAMGLASAGAIAAHRLLPESFSIASHQSELALARAVPDAVDLLAAVLRAGLPDAEAVALVAGSVGEPLQGHLHRVARQRLLGATAPDAWHAVAQVPQLQDLARAMARHAETGSSIAPVLDRVAADARRDYFTAAQAATRAAAVRAVVPLAVCFLPSFLLLGVVPVVMSLLSGLAF